MASNKNTALTSGICVSAVARYEERFSAPDEMRFIFSYEIEIENRTEKSVQLISRTWDIFDANGQHKTVQGKGVIGEQPVILPGNSFSYRSACDLLSPFGNMKGAYMLLDYASKELVQVVIPEFKLEAPWMLN